MTESHAAFEDLELDTSLMLRDPDAFDRQVQTKADELRATLKSDHSVQGLVDNLKVNPAPLKADWVRSFNDMYEQIDALPLEELPNIITAFRQFTNDLETMLRDRAVHAVAAREGNSASKKVAHAQYIALREKHKMWADFMRTMKIGDYKALPALPGNYGSGDTQFKNYVWIFQTDGGSYRNHKAVIRRINREAGYEVISPDIFMFDFIENWCHNDKISQFSVDFKEVA